MGVTRHQCLQLARSGAIPKPLCFPSPPLCRPSSLFLFLFCCRFNSSSWTLSVLPERYLVSPLPMWHPLPSFSPPCIHPQQANAGQCPVVLGRLVTVSTTPCSESLAPICPVDCDFGPINHQHLPPRGGLGRGLACSACALTTKLL